MSFTGHENADQHRSTGNRAWCLSCGEWCYERIPCACCTIALAEADPCPHCDGTGRRSEDDKAAELEYHRQMALSSEPTPAVRERLAALRETAQ